MSGTIRVDEASVKSIWDALQTIDENAGNLLQSLQDATNGCLNAGMQGKYADALRDNQNMLNSNIYSSSKNLQFMEDDVYNAVKTFCNVDLEIANNIKKAKG